MEEKEVTGSVALNVAAVRGRIVDAARKAGRDLAGVTLVAVTKTVDVPQVEEALAAGCRVMGENRVQEADRKLQVLAGRGEWHLIGHLQKNKVKKAVELFNLIHSVDSLPLAAEISRRAGEAGKRQRILLQVNTSGEESKFGVEPDDAVVLARDVAALAHLDVRGLMTVGAFLPDPEDVRPCFRQLKELAGAVAALGLPHTSMEHLSMGMTNDFAVAIEEGATLVRVGRAIFGERN